MAQQKWPRSYVAVRNFYLRRDGVRESVGVGDSVTLSAAEFSLCGRKVASPDSDAAAAAIAERKATAKKAA